MRLSTVFELLLIFLLIAFAAYGRVIDKNEINHRYLRSVGTKSKQNNQGVDVMSLKQAIDNVNKYCTCSTNNICNCCQDFQVPLFSLNGKGCAHLQYQEKNKLAVQLHFRDNTLISTVINGDKPRSLCVPMPGGLSQFCGQVYAIKREDVDHFQACFGLELKSNSKVEATMPGSCFRFGPDGIQVQPPEPFVASQDTEQPAEDDDSDDDDIFGLDDDDEDDDDDDDEVPLKDSNVKPTGQTEDSEDDDDDDDYSLGLSAVFDFFTDDDDSTKKKTTTAAPPLTFTIPTINKTPLPVIENHSIVSTVKPTKVDTVISSSENPENLSNPEDTSQDSEDENTKTPLILDSTVTDTIEEASTAESLPVIAEESNDVAHVINSKKPFAPEKMKVGVKVKKTSVTSTSVNAIKNDDEKNPLVNVQHHEEDNDDDNDFLSAAVLDDDDDDEDDNDNDDEKEETNTEKHEDNNEEEENEKHQESNNADDGEETNDDDDYNDDDDDDDDDDDVVALSDLISDDKQKKKPKEKIKKIQTNLSHESTSKPNEEDVDYETEVAELLARKLRSRQNRGRQSKVMRL